MKIENGQTISIPQQMLQGQKSQIVYLYQQHCDAIGIDALSDRTIYSILNSLCASEQKVISGVDEFVKNCSEGWANLKTIIGQLTISREIKNELNTFLEKSQLYLKSKYGCQCSESQRMTTHCSIFALSQSNNPFYSQACGHNHDAFCEGMN